MTCSTLHEKETQADLWTDVLGVRLFDVLNNMNNLANDGSMQTT